MSRVLSGFGLLAVLSGVGCAGCEPESGIECAYHGQSYPAGESFAADDGCNQCICSEEGVIICTSLVCPGSDAGTPDAGDEDGGFMVVVDYPATACILASVDGESPSGAPTTGQRLVLADQGWAAPTTGATITSVSWRLVSAPPGTRSPLDASGLITPDLVGAYALRASIGDDQGGTADQDCTLQVQPPADLYIELVWDRDDTDVDLRVIQADGDGKFCTRLAETPLPVGAAAQVCEAARECAFDNCKAQTEGTRPDWDGDQVLGSDGDPTLLFDVLTGYGPEAISVLTPAPGTYLVVGYFWSAHTLLRPARADVRLWVHGQLRGAGSAPLVEKQWWEALRFTVPEAGGELCVDALIEGSERCGSLPLCAPAPTCDECLDDATCGPGSQCSTSLARCMPRVRGCHDDGDCAGEAIACIPATQSCWQPQCDGDQLLCLDPRKGCDDALRMCVLPPPVCAETDEPNNTVVSATVVSGTSVDGTLCRGDVDLLAVAGHAGRRLRATVTFVSATAEHYQGDTLELLDAAGQVLYRRMFGQGPAALVAADVAADATLYLRLTGVASGVDLVSYRLQISEVDAYDCGGEAGEPNNSVEQAANSVLAAGSHTRLLCGGSDVDHHQVQIPAEQRLQARALDAADGLNLDMLSVSGTLLHQSLYGDPTPTVVHNARGAARTVVLRVMAPADSDPARDSVAPYRLELTLGPAPSCNDGLEPNDTPAEATVAHSGVFGGVICDLADSDLFAVDVPALGTLSATLTLDPSEGDLDLRVLDRAGQVRGMSGSTAAVEQVRLDPLGAGTYYVVVYPYQGSRTDAQPYTLDLLIGGWGDAGVGEDVSAAEDASPAPDATGPDAVAAPDGGVEDTSQAPDGAQLEDTAIVDDAATVEDAA